MNNGMMKTSPEVEAYGLSEEVQAIRTERALKLEKLIESLEAINRSNHWKIIVSEIFEPELQLLRKQLINEKDTVEVFRLQGKVSWAEKKTDMHKLILQFRSELSGIRKNMHESES